MSSVHSCVCLFISLSVYRAVSTSNPLWLELRNFSSGETYAMASSTIKSQTVSHVTSTVSEAIRHTQKWKLSYTHFAIVGFFNLHRVENKTRREPCEYTLRNLRFSHFAHSLNILISVTNKK